MRVIGPNSQGLANFGTGAVLSFSTMFLEAPPQDGPVAIVSQSGGMSVVPYGLLRQRGIGVRHVHATGNDCDVNVPELASVVAEEPDLKLLLLYLESIRDAAPLAELARIARERGLPIIALKAGRTAAGQEAAKSHTGALANEDRVVDAFFEQQGIWRARDMGELVSATEIYLKGWRPQGRRLVAISNSGAVCVMAADAASAAGMPMARLSDETRAALGGILPSFATTTNPVDITAALLSNSGLFSDILPVLARDPAADAFLIGIPVAGQGYDVEAFARDSATFAAQTGKPLVTAIPQASIAARFKEHGSARLRDGERSGGCVESVPVAHGAHARVVATASGVHGAWREAAGDDTNAQRGRQSRSIAALRRPGCRASAVQVGRGSGAGARAPSVHRWRRRVAQRTSRTNPSWDWSGSICARRRKCAARTPTSSAVCASTARNSTACSSPRWSRGGVS